MSCLLRSVVRRTIVGHSLPRPLFWHGCRFVHSSLVTFRYSRPPRQRIDRPSLLNEVLARTPDSLKLALGLTAVGSLVVFVALPLFALVVPPLCVGSLMAYKIAQRRNRKQMSEKWTLLKDSTLIFRPRNSANPLVLPPIEQINSDLANFVLRRVSDAFLLNEDGVADYFNIESVNDIALGVLDGVQYDWNVSLQTINGVVQEVEDMITVQSRYLYDKRSGDKIAKVIFSLKNLDTPIFQDLLEQSISIGKSQCVIEIIPLGFVANKRFVIKTPSSEGDIIDVEGETRTL
ncbi:hypothetical protein KL938_000617 [Ogataea parapolymorpha]|nr:hypothetical protein KL938_000617 [Ogataea parapolymorpha]